MSHLLITGGRIIDPSQGRDQIGDLLITDGVIANDSALQYQVDLQQIRGGVDRTIDATGMIVCPGFIDPHVALREPGFEEDETTATGTKAALAGGFTSIACRPDTDPVIDNRAAAEFILLQAERAGHCNVYPLGAVTKRHAGEELAEIGQLVEAGAVGFTDAKHPIVNAEIMRRALEYTGMFDRPIFSMPKVPELIQNGVMHEGFHSTLLGLTGIPAAAESIMVGRDLALAEMTQGRLHLMCLSTRNSVELVRQAKESGVRVTAEVTPQHLALTDESLHSFDSNYKLDPPLRTREHIEALIAGLKNGTIDIITADHEPLSEEKKDRELDLVPCGIVGLETLLPICVKTLIEPGQLTWSELIAKLTVNPARVLGIPKGTLQPGVAADITLLAPDEKWVISAEQFHSKSRNTPFEQWEVRGRVKTVIVSGDVRYDQSG